MKTYILTEEDLKAIAASLWYNNDWFQRDGQRVLLSEIENELLGYTQDHAERCDAVNQPCLVGE